MPSPTVLIRFLTVISLFLSGDGKCVICDSYVRPCTLVRICDECNYGSYQGRCVICGGPGVSDAYYCKECTIQEKDVSTVPEYLSHICGVFICDLMNNSSMLQANIFYSWDSEPAT